MESKSLIRISCLSVFLVAAANAQVSAILSGTVADQSGAVISAATVTAKNVDTGVVRDTTTDGQGHYQFFSLPVGNYEIRGKKPGFNEEVRAGVNLMVGQSGTVNMDLHIGESSQQVTVNGDAPLVGVTSRRAGTLRQSALQTDQPRSHVPRLRISVRRHLASDQCLARAESRRTGFRRHL